MAPNSHIDITRGYQAHSNDNSRLHPDDMAGEFVAAVKQGFASYGDISAYEAGVYGTAEGFVYFIGVGDPYPTQIKIGFTAGDPQRRKAALQTGCPFRLCLLGFVFGTRAMERELHDVMRDSRLEGEWFNFDNYVEDVVNAQLYDRAR